jgi:hypothetical protein
MKKLASTVTGIATALIVFSISHAANAQVGNQPYAFGGRIGANVGAGAGVSPGMSSAYREIILERELQGRSTKNNFIRGVDGSLVNIDRKGDQAFARPPTSPYISSQSSFSLGIGGYDSGSAGLLRAAIRPTEAPTEDMPAVFGTAPGAVPINSWIMQLTTLPELAS